MKCFSFFISTWFIDYFSKKKKTRYSYLANLLRLSHSADHMWISFCACSSPILRGSKQIGSLGVLGTWTTHWSLMWPNRSRNPMGSWFPARYDFFALFYPISISECIQFVDEKYLIWLNFKLLRAVLNDFKPLKEISACSVSLRESPSVGSSSSTRRGSSSTPPSTISPLAGAWTKRWELSRY